MPLHHAREAYLSSGPLVTTLQALGLGGVVYPGALAWDTYPQAASPVSVSPNAANETDGAAVTIIAAAAITVPYLITHVSFRSGAEGNFQLRFKLQSSTPVIYRTLRACNDRTVGPNGGIQSPCFPPIPIAASLGFQVILATSPGSGPSQNTCATALKSSSVVPVAELLAIAPKALGGMVPGGAFTVTAETFNINPWLWGNYVELTPGIPTPALITALWGQIITSTDNIQVAFATGASGGEVDWGIFGWPNPTGNADADCRHDLMPYPFYLPANTRLAMRARAAGTVNTTFQAAAEYIPVPLR